MALAQERLTMMLSESVIKGQGGRLRRPPQLIEVSLR